MTSQFHHWANLRGFRPNKPGMNSQPLPTQELRPQSPPSEFTEILDTDFDSDSQSDVPNDSSRRSIRSLGMSSVTTASTPDDIKTPDSAGLSGFHFHIDGSSITGPDGPHLFRMSDVSMDIKSTVEIDLIFDDAPDSATTPLYASASKLGLNRRDTPVPRVLDVRTSLESVPEVEDSSIPDESRVASWTPQDVVNWMQRRNIDDSIVEKFFVNDISGSILLELQAEDLKELDIQSFGKRHSLMAFIRELRENMSADSNDVQPSPAVEPMSREPTPSSTSAEVGPRSCNATPIVDEEEYQARRREGSQGRRQHRNRRQRVIGPSDSVSIVGIEQTMPKLHRCSKGEECRKWQRQQARISRVSRDLPEEARSSPIIVLGDPGNAATAQNLVKSPHSEFLPSVVASSDALGLAQSANALLAEEKLQHIEPRDPQENVRNFLNFQRLSRLQPVNDPATPPRETFPSPNSDTSPGNLAENLRSLPRLRIPSSHGSGLGHPLSGPVSGQRTITPSVMRSKVPFHNNVNNRTTELIEDLFSPSDYYRQDPQYGLTSPLCEADLPVTAIPVGPIERVLSQSVPPDMRFGNYGQPSVDPIHRPISTKVENHRRKMSAFPSQPALARLDEGRVISPINSPEDLERTPRAAHHRINPFSPTGEVSTDIIHSGWMKKRKTTRLLRHEWNEHHFALRGTQLGMYADENSAHRDSKALEYIDVDDYAVACSSVASSSKLTAAFKKTVLKRKDDTLGDTAFAFSLIPSPKNVTDRKSPFSSNGKTHHFAVQNREERIEWLREFMLVRALKEHTRSGAKINMNGNAL
ncbi:SAM and PH domain-containing protein Boi1 [Penicillium ucsense]|uniref:SAM and PH domain-containing protein Boi1 n=1 Tax=Penicillium ucsense TaxID=2839758 RepID=A0A8J8W3W4_9EURO|nr:SAM and PH domain-containing protein Boi1 [Penicillium ucsense]KAF7734445.1 SAM and PH domain-containing protein Boi1 [Penicillium ucsense]